MISTIIMISTIGMIDTVIMTSTISIIDQQKFAEQLNRYKKRPPHK